MSGSVPVRASRQRNYGDAPESKGSRWFKSTPDFRRRKNAIRTGLYTSRRKIESHMAQNGLELFVTHLFTLRETVPSGLGLHTENPQTIYLAYPDPYI